MNYKLNHNENVHLINLADADSIDISPTSDGNYHILKDNVSYTAKLISIDTIKKTTVVEINGRSYSFKINNSLDQLIDEMGLNISNNEVSKEIKAPMPGLILDISVKEGQTIQAGDTLLILEAMKMENVIKAESDAIVEKVHLEKGQTVEKNQVIITFE